MITPAHRTIICMTTRERGRGKSIYIHRYTIKLLFIRCCNKRTIYILRHCDDDKKNKKYIVHKRATVIQTHTHTHTRRISDEFNRTTRGACRERINDTTTTSLSAARESIPPLPVVYDSGWYEKPWGNCHFQMLIVHGNYPTCIFQRARSRLSRGSARGARQWRVIVFLVCSPLSLSPHSRRSASRAILILIFSPRSISIFSYYCPGTARALALLPPL